MRGGLGEEVVIRGLGPILRFNKLHASHRFLNILELLLIHSFARGTHGILKASFNPYLFLHFAYLLPKIGC